MPQGASREPRCAGPTAPRRTKAAASLASEGLAGFLLRPIRSPAACAVGGTRPCGSRQGLYRPGGLPTLTPPGLPLPPHDGREHAAAACVDAYAPGPPYRTYWIHVVSLRAPYRPWQRAALAVPCVVDTRGEPCRGVRTAHCVRCACPGQERRAAGARRAASGVRGARDDADRRGRARAGAPAGAHDLPPPPTISFRESSSLRAPAGAQDLP